MNKIFLLVNIGYLTDSCARYSINPKIHLQYRSIQTRPESVEVETFSLVTKLILAYPQYLTPTDNALL